MKRKILIAITQSNFGGAQRHVFDLARTLATRDFEVVVACGGSGRLVSAFNDVHVRVVPLPALHRHINIFDDMRMFFRFADIIRQERPDILHLHSSKMGGLGALVGKVMRVRHIVFTVHGWEFNAPRPKWQKGLIRFFSVLTVLLADKTIAVSAATKRDLRILQCKIVVVRNGLDDIDFLDRDQARVVIAERSHDRIDNKGFWYVTIAELHPVKGLDRAIESFAEVARTIPNTHYVVIGEGHEHAHLNESIRTHELNGRVHLVGFIPEAARLLKAADVFVLPSRSESLSYAILEAGLASLPTIASDVGGIPEIIISSKHGILVPPGDASALFDAMVTLGHDEHMRTLMGQTLRQRVMRDFSLSRMVDGTIAAYE